MGLIAFAVTAGNPRGEDPAITIHDIDALRAELDVIRADPGQDARGRLDEARADELLMASGWARTGRWIYDSGQWGANVEEGPADMDQALRRMRAYRAATAGRDAIVRYALRAGANVNQVSKETGISRPTIYRIREARPLAGS